MEVWVMKNKMMIKVGAWAFTIGVVLALFAGVLAGFMKMSPQGTAMITGLLVVLGLVVGFLNVSGEEVSKFLMASVAVMIALFTAGSAIQSQITTLGTLGTMMWAVMSNINVFVFPATIIVAIKSIFALARD
jgi:hypothetical protein